MIPTVVLQPRGCAAGRRLRDLRLERHDRRHQLHHPRYFDGLQITSDPAPANAYNTFNTSIIGGTAGRAAAPLSPSSTGQHVLLGADRSYTKMDLTSDRRPRFARHRLPAAQHHGRRQELCADRLSGNTAGSLAANVTGPYGGCKPTYQCRFGQSLRHQRRTPRSSPRTIRPGCLLVPPGNRGRRRILVKRYGTLACNFHWGRLRHPRARSPHPILFSSRCMARRSRPSSSTSLRCWAPTITRSPTSSKWPSSIPQLKFDMPFLGDWQGDLLGDYGRSFIELHPAGGRQHHPAEQLAAADQRGRRALAGADRQFGQRQCP